jgi:hypothetical protein
LARLFPIAAGGAGRDEHGDLVGLERWKGGNTMTMNPSDRLLSQPTRGDAETAIASARAHGAARPADVEALIREYYASAHLAGLDAAILVAQSCHETGGWTSSWWTGRLNPAGIGITGDPAQNEDSHVWTSGKDAADSHLAHLALYASGVSAAGWFDPRAAAYHEAYGDRAIAHTIADLAGTWAVDPAYAAGVCARGNAIFPGIPDQGKETTPVPTTPQPAVRGHVPKPPMIDDTAAGRTKRVGSGRESDRPRAGHIVGTCHHTSDGYFAGNESVFDDPAYGALTDFQVGGPWDGAMDGVIEQFIADDAPIVPWANGTVGTNRAPYGDAPAFLAAFGQDNVNVVLRSIETTDGQQPDRPKGGKQIESLCFLTAWIHSEQAHQTAETFQWNMPHREFGVDHQQCPGAWIVNNVDAIQERVKAIMRAYQEGTPLDPPLVVTYPPGWQGGHVPQPGGGTTPPTPAPAPKPPEPPTPAKAKLPKGMSTGLAQKFFNPRGVRPADGEPVAHFQIAGTVSQEWLRHGIATIPAGGTWQDGRWPELVQVVVRGDGRRDWHFSDGWVFEQAAPT